MRTIKFRAWDKKEKRMFEVRKLAIFKEWKGNLTKQKYSVTENYNTCKNQIELMQFTGLKDKNGKEIYEGDIVRFVDDYGKTCGRVFYERVTASFNVMRENPLCEYGTYVWAIHCFELEVIGNIFENLGLLKEE